MSEKNELVVIEKLELVPFFTKGDQVDEILETIAAEARSHVPDVSTLKGRNAIKAMVTKVTKSKTYLESSGKDLAAEYKEIPKRIDANRKKVRDFLTELQAEIRNPLTEWEEEQIRIKEEREAQEAAQKLREQIEADHEIALLMNEKFDREAEEARKAAEEAERLRKEQEEKERLEREARIAQEAKEAAEREAKEREERLIREAKEREEKAERDRLAAIDREKELERQRIEAEERAKIQAEEAEKKRLADIEAARQSEIQRQQEEQERLRKEQEQREANIAHKKKINNAALTALVEAGLTDEQAKIAVTAIALGKVPHIKVNY